MAPKRQRRVVGTLVKTTRKVVEETLQVSVEGGEGNGEQNHSKESKVVEVEVDVEEMKAQESQTWVSPLDDSQANEKAEEEETNRRKEESKEAPKEGAEEPPQRDEKQEKEGRGDQDKEELGSYRRRETKEGRSGSRRRREGEEERERREVEEEEEVWWWCGGGWRRVQEVCVQGAEAGGPRDGGVVEGDGGARRHDDRHVREAGGRGGTAVHVRRKGDPVIKRDPGCSAPGAAWGARQACHLSGDESCVQLHVC